MKITAVHKEEGKINSYKLDNGQVVSKEECVQMVKNGEIENCNVGRSRDNEEFVRTKRDDEDKPGQITNLDDLPTF
jgi:hypothetical protein